MFATRERLIGDIGLAKQKPQGPLSLTHLQQSLPSSDFIFVATRLINFNSLWVMGSGRLLLSSSVFLKVDL